MTWSGTLVNVPTNPRWKWQWHPTALGRVKNPDWPDCGGRRQESDRRRPGCDPGTADFVAPGTTATDWIYGVKDVTFGQSMRWPRPSTLATTSSSLPNQAKIAETRSRSPFPRVRNRIAVGHDLSLAGPHNGNGDLNSSRRTWA